MSRNRLSPTVTTNLLRLLWIVLVLWGELGVYFWTISYCKWPVHGEPGEALHVLLISDTQISTASLSPEGSSLLPRPRKFLADSFLKKSWRVTRSLNPHVVFFLGDLLGEGKHIKSEAQFSDLAAEFKATFTMNTSTAVYYLPGNNDVGMGILTPPNGSTRRYFEKHFSPLNRAITLKGHTFFALDAPGLVDEDYQRNAHGVSFDHWEPIPGGAVEAVRSAAAAHHQPLILLSHIPLYRPDGASCGLLRERGSIDRGAGPGYQNTLGKQTTTFLIEELNPSIIFSGDNRDYCEYVHRRATFDIPAETSVSEITIKSFSPAPLIRRPGFQTLSLVEPTHPNDKKQSLLHRPCLLPDQTLIFTGYFWGMVMTVFILLAINIQRIRQFRLTKFSNPSLTPSPTWSHETSPFLQAANDTISEIWPPRTPFPPKTPKSPRPGLSPSSFRTPLGSAIPTFRASSRPMTPQGNNSPMPSPQLIPPMHEEEDTMFPDQYTTQRDVRHLHDEEWTPVGRDDTDFGSPSANGGFVVAGEPQAFSPPSQFISAPGGILTHRRQHSWRVLWSKTFVFGGRRRIFRLRLPSIPFWTGGFTEMLQVLRNADQRILLRRRRGIVPSTLLESVSIIWPAGVLWVLINNCVF